MDPWWRDKAACKGRDIHDFAARDGERHEFFMKRIGSIERVCPKSCPVRAECARDALIAGDKGVIRAGVMLPESSGPRDVKRYLLAVAAEPALDEIEKKRFDRRKMEMDLLKNTRARR